VCPNRLIDLKKLTFIL